MPGVSGHPSAPEQRRAKPKPAVLDVGHIEEASASCEVLAHRAAPVDVLSLTTAGPGAMTQRRERQATMEPSTSEPKQDTLAFTVEADSCAPCPLPDTVS